MYHMYLYLSCSTRLCLSDIFDTFLKDVGLLKIGLQKKMKSVMMYCTVEVEVSHMAELGIKLQAGKEILL